MKKTIFILFVLLFAKISLSVAQNEKFKALYMYNFTKYMEWPSAEKDGDFIITVCGDKKMTDELNVIAQKRKVGFQNIVIKNVNSPLEIAKSHIVFIGKKHSKEIANVKSRFAQVPTVIISDESNGIPKGAGINYVMMDGKPLFEISKSNIAQHNVKVVTDLLKLGIEK